VSTGAASDSLVPDTPVAPTGVAVKAAARTTTLVGPRDVGRIQILPEVPYYPRREPGVPIILFTQWRIGATCDGRITSSTTTITIIIIIPQTCLLYSGHPVTAY
jgi:hypothetical protein